MGTAGGNVVVAIFALTVATVTLWFNVVQPHRAKRKAALSVRWETLYRVRPRPARRDKEQVYEEKRSERLVLTNHGPGVATMIGVDAYPAVGEPDGTVDAGRARLETTVLPFPVIQPAQEIHLPILTIGCGQGLTVDLEWTDGSGNHTSKFVLAPHIVF
jgi:hypothetical protein